MGLFWIWPVLVLIGVVLLGYLAYRLTRNRGPGPGEKATSPGPARQILDERYARGEIDEQDYRQRRGELR
ncbi:SHOCT domain-containing protein [uncultured Pseudonocardia sp.]|uniref:SHOCT domain-containing protein n=1 Tax=uncultured Pseudonocardia sp. TaxID=211455 RepID=UPI002626DBC1|nr:SHOCT domain-containing protein [uncultured Pseudonocardia sp.]